MVGGKDMLYLLVGGKGILMIDYLVKENFFLFGNGKRYFYWLVGVGLSYCYWLISCEDYFYLLFVVNIIFNYLLVVNICIIFVDWVSVKDYMVGNIIDWM